MRLTDTTINTVRRIASELRPVALDTLGLTAAIEWQARQFQDRTESPSSAMHPGECSFESRAINSCLSHLSGTLTNILRHAQATRVNIQMKEEDVRIHLDN